jgi:PKD repeat protein
VKKAILFFVFIVIQLSLFSQEICDNAIDDDGDTFIDLNDTDCDCEGFLGDVETLIPNHSFENNTCCPTGFSQLYCADAWDQASSATSDYFNYCDFDMYPVGLPPAFPLPGEPGDDGFAGFIISESFPYLEYIGTEALLSPLSAGTTYALSIYTAFSSGDLDFELSLFGSPNVADMPWLGTACPIGVGDWELLASQDITYSPDGAWQEVILTFTPAVDINAIAIGGPCDPITPFSYYYIDEITLLDYDSFYGFEQSGGWCAGDLVLTVETDTVGGTWQWYKDGIALVGETGESLAPVPFGEGVFSAVYRLGGYCKRIDYSSPEIFEVDFDFVSDCILKTAEFTNLSVGDELADVIWDWDFGDGVSLNEFEPTHLYATSGTYEVMLTGISSDETCNDSITIAILVPGVPVVVVDLSGDCLSEWIGYDLGTANNPINFIDDSFVEAPSVITEWIWDFGDGFTSTEENPIHTYSTPGIYDISLTVTSDAGCTNSILSGSIAITALLPNFTLENDCLTEEFTFENTSTLVAPSIFDSWEWNYGDGTTGDTENGVHT